MSPSAARTKLEGSGTATKPARSAYLAISDAVNDPLRKGERRRIVAITDGFNEQGNVGVLNQVTAQALGAQLTAHPQVTLDIIGFGNQLVPGARANAQELADMKGLAGGHGGVFYQAANSDDLLNGILKSLGLEKRKP